MEQGIEQQEVFERLKTVIAAQVGDGTGLDETTSLQGTLGMDSLEIVDLGLAVEREFGIELDTQQLRACRTLGDLTALILQQRSLGDTDLSTRGAGAPSST